jgi:hypothetical protein
LIVHAIGRQCDVLVNPHRRGNEQKKREQFH